MSEEKARVGEALEQCLLLQKPSQTSFSFFCQTAEAWVLEDDEGVDRDWGREPVHHIIAGFRQTVENHH